MKRIATLKISHIVVAIALVFTFSSCRSLNPFTGGDNDLKKKTKNELIKDVLDKELKYKNISGKVNLEIQTGESKKSVKTAAFAKIIKDSVIQISIRPILGMEVFRLSVTLTKIYVLDRMNKKYVEEEINDTELLSKIGFNYYNLQAILTNCLFVPGENALVETHTQVFDMDKADQMYLLKTKSKQGTLYNFAIDGADRVSSVLIHHPEKDYTIQWSYNEYIKEGSYIYPTEMQGKAIVNNKQLNIKLSFGKLEIDKEIEVDTSASSKYTKVGIMDVLEPLLKMK